MGVTGLLRALREVARPVSLTSFRGHTVAVDAYAWLHRALHSVALDASSLLPSPLPATAAALTAAVAAAAAASCVDLCTRDALLLRDRYGVRPLFVFDGADQPLKAATDAERARLRAARDAAAHKQTAALLYPTQNSNNNGNSNSNSNNSSGSAAASAPGASAASCARVAAPSAGDCAAVARLLLQSQPVTPTLARAWQLALRALGLPVLVAPFEADGQLARLARAGAVTAVLAEDSDLLVVGCRRLLTRASLAAGTAIMYDTADLHRAPLLAPLLTPLLAPGANATASASAESEAFLSANPNNINNNNRHTTITLESTDTEVDTETARDVPRDWCVRVASTHSHIAANAPAAAHGHPPLRDGLCLCRRNPHAALWGVSPLLLCLQVAAAASGCDYLPLAARSAHLSQALADLQSNGSNGAATSNATGSESPLQSPSHSPALSQQQQDSQAECASQSQATWPLQPPGGGSCVGVGVGGVGSRASSPMLSPPAAASASTSANAGASASADANGSSSNGARSQVGLATAVAVLAGYLRDALLPDGVASLPPPSLLPALTAAAGDSGAAAEVDSGAAQTETEAACAAGVAPRGCPLWALTAALTADAAATAATAAVAAAAAAAASGASGDCDAVDQSALTDSDDETNSDCDYGSDS